MKLRELLPFNRTWTKRIGISLIIAAPSYGANILFLGVLVSYFHFYGLHVLSPVVIADVFGLGVNAMLYPTAWKITHHRWFSEEDLFSGLPKVFLG